MNQDQKVTPNDLLIIFNSLRRWGAGALDDVEQQISTEDQAILQVYRMDVNDDGKFNAQDAVIVINELNRQWHTRNAVTTDIEDDMSEGEGEWSGQAEDQALPFDRSILDDWSRPVKIKGTQGIFGESSAR